MSPLDLLYIVLLLGGLIFFHELGHFVAARLMGIHVVVFSIGFGPALLRLRRRKKVADLRPGALPRMEVVLAALPFGGYVQLYGADPTEDVPEEHQAVSFGGKPVWRRLIVMAAGPAFNLLLPFFIYFVLTAGATQLQPSVVGMVDREGPAGEAGLEPGDRVVAIADEPVDYWWQLQDLISARPGQTFDIAVERRGERLEWPVMAEVQPDPNFARIGVRRDLGRVGIGAGYTLPFVSVLAGTPAASAGVRFYDRVLAVDGQPVERFHDLERLLAERRAHPTTLTILRGHPAVELRPDGFVAPSEELEIRMPPAERDAMRGLVSVDCVVSRVYQGSIAQEIGLAAGDLLLALGDRPCPDFVWLHTSMGAEGPERTLRWLHDGVPRQATRSSWISEVAVPHELQKDRTVAMFGVEMWPVGESLAPVPNARPLRDAFGRSLSQGLHDMDLTFWSIVGLFRQKVAFKELSGPLGIAQLAAHAGRQGWSQFFWLMAFLSISLGLINLLPIPILDGGHLLFLSMEAVRRRPVSLRTRQVATYLGFAFIVLLMVLVIRNDVARIW